MASTKRGSSTSSRKRSGGTSRKSSSSSRSASGRSSGKSTRKSSGRRSSKREMLDTGTSKRYARRTEGGRFGEQDEMRRSLRQDRVRKAKTTVKSGQGDRGDQKKR